MFDIYTICGTPKHSYSEYHPRKCHCEMIYSRFFLTSCRNLLYSRGSTPVQGPTIVRLPTHCESKSQQVQSAIPIPSDCTVPVSSARSCHSAVDHTRLATHCTRLGPSLYCVAARSIPPHGKQSRVIIHFFGPPQMFCPPARECVLTHDVKYRVLSSTILELIGSDGH